MPGITVVCDGPQTHEREMHFTIEKWMSYAPPLRIGDIIGRCTALDQGNLGVTPKCKPCTGNYKIKGAA